MTLEPTGLCEAAFASVGEAFIQGFTERGELGGAVAVHLNGRLVVDLWAGLADPVNGDAWGEDTIAEVERQVRSMGKGTRYYVPRP